MSFIRRTFAPVSLALAAFAAAPAAQAQFDPVGFTLYTAGDIFLTPRLFESLASSGPRTWQSLMDFAAPAIAPYAETFRQLALHHPPPLRPEPIPPVPGMQAHASRYSQVVSFGDSMSDTGIFHQISEGLSGVGLPAAPNHLGRFSDGQVIVESMSSALGLPLLNYAVAGATSGTANLLPFKALQIGVQRQIDEHLDHVAERGEQVDPQALYVIWAGPDDFYSGNDIYLKSTAPRVTANIRRGMKTLYRHGARHFFVPQMPDLSITPSAKDHLKLQKTYLTEAKKRSAEFATQLSAMLKAFARQYPGAKVRTFATYEYSQRRMAQAAAEGNNVTTPCYTPPYMGLPGPVCEHPDKHLFWDTNHPTHAGSLIIGGDFAKAAVGDPLPSR